MTALLTCAMAFSMMQLYLLGALGPRLVDDLDVSPTVLGLTTTVGFGAAAALSPAGGRVVDRLGPRRCLVALLLVSAVDLALIGSAPGAGSSSQRSRWADCRRRRRTPPRTRRSWRRCRPSAAVRGSFVGGVACAARRWPETVRPS
ncbi:MFS transporter [Streptomyces chartreusis]|uniref:MFS transporter n=1 Tax=Streptomyces chartreusis TaxID=1969 RepID=UPI0033A6C1DB